MSQDKIKLIAQLKDELSGPLGRIGGRMTSFGKNVGKAAAAVAALAAAAFAAAKKLAEYGAAIYDTAQMSGVGVERIQALAYQFEQTGGSAQSFQNSLRGVTTFLRMAGSATSEQGRLLTEMGLDYEELQNMSPDELFLTLTDAVAGLDLETKQMTAAAVIFGGRYSQQVLGLIQETEGDVRGAVAAFEEMGVALSEDQVARLKQFDDAVTSMKYELKGLAADAIVPLLPTIQGLMDIFLEIASDIMPKIAPVLERVTELMGDLLERALEDENLMGLVDTIMSLADVLLDTMEPSLGMWLDLASQIAPSLQTLMEAVALLAEPVSDLIEAAEPLILMFSDMASGLIEGVATQLKNLMPIITGIVNALGAVTGMLSGWRAQVDDMGDSIDGTADMLARAVETGVLPMEEATEQLKEQLDAMLEATGPTTAALEEYDRIMKAWRDGTYEAEASAWAFQQALDNNEIPALLRARDALLEVTDRSQDQEDALADLQGRLMGLEQSSYKAAMGQIELARATMLASGLMEPGGMMDRALEQRYIQLERLAEQARKAAQEAPHVAGVGAVEDELPGGGTPETQAENELNELKGQHHEEQMARLEKEAQRAQQLKEHQAQAMKDLDEQQAEADAERLDGLQQMDSLLTGAIRGSIENMGDGLLTLIEDGHEAADDWREMWWEQIKRLILTSAFKAFANVITGGLGGGLLSTFGFQQGGTVPARTAQHGDTVSDSGPYGDRHLYLLERGERVIPREQVLSGVGAQSASPVMVNLEFRSLTPPGPGDMVRLGSMVIQALRRAGVEVSSVG